MATKLKNFSRHGVIKALSFLLFVACVTALALTSAYALHDWHKIGFWDHFTGRTDTYAAEFWRLAAVFAALGLGAVVTFIHSLSVCGRVRGGENTAPHTVRLSAVWDRPWLDALLAAVVVAGFVIESLSSRIYDWYRPYTEYTVFNRYQVLFGAALGVWTAIAFWWLLSAVKRLKNRSILRYTMTFVVLTSFFRVSVRYVLRPAAKYVLRPAARFLYDNMPLTALGGLCAAVYTGGIFLLVMLTDIEIFWGVILIAWTALGIVFCVKTAAYISSVAKGLRRLAGGDYTTPMPEEGRGVLREMAGNVNAATAGLRSAVEKELTSQRMKSELITNVSHDLRTPLTSVITYADLLQSEGLSSPGAEKYLEIICQKARRLQLLTEDLFDAAKASSGETKAVPAPLDLRELIGQALGEMGDRLRAVPLEVRLTGGCGEVMADGKLLCRVFENLFRNIEKYAMPGTRVYIDMADAGKEAVVTVKNISAAALDGDAERLAERFTRGDEARSSEGSGLGLAIVRSFMELQKGRCGLSADGDLFKVTLTLPLSEPGAAAETARQSPSAQKEDRGGYAPAGWDILEDTRQGAGRPAKGIYQAVENFRNLLRRHYREDD